jgi:hypothetical protein
MIDEMIDMGSIIGDMEGGLWCVIEVTDEGNFQVGFSDGYFVNPHLLWWCEAALIFLAASANNYHWRAVAQENHIRRIRV